MSFYERIKSRADNLTANIKAGFDKSKPTLDMIGKQVGLFLAEMVEEAQEKAADAVSGPEKKEAVLTAATTLFDTAIIGFIAIPWVPKFISVIIVKYSRPIYIAIVSGTIDAFVSTFKVNKVSGFTAEEEGGIS